MQEVRFGVDRRDLLESALNRPKQSVNFEDADLVRQSATLCYGLIKNHPWLGGNKRTATFLMDTFLQINSLRLTTSNRDVVELALNVEADQWGVDEVEVWVRKRTV